MKIFIAGGSGAIGMRLIPQLVSQGHTVTAMTRSEGKRARLALRLPLEQKLRIADWKELGTADFPYDKGRSYRLTVENRGASIRAFIDGKLVLTAQSDELPTGKAVGPVDVREQCARQCWKSSRHAARRGDRRERPAAA